MENDTINKVLEVRRVLNEQYVSLLYIEADGEPDEKDLSTLKSMLHGAVGVLDGFAERLIKRNRKG